MASVRKRKWTYNGVEREGWEVRYEDPTTGKRPSKTFAMKKDADAFKRKVEREIEDGVHTAHSERKAIPDVADKFIKAYEQKRRDGQIGMSRYKAICSTLNLYIIPHFKAKTFDDLTLKDLEKWWHDIGRDGRLAPFTRAQYLIIFQQLESYAHSRGFTKAKTVEKFRKETKGIQGKKIKTFTAREVGLILSNMDHRPWRVTERGHLMYKCYLLMAIFCGMRFGEITAVQSKNLDFDHRVIRVRTNLTKWGELKGPKTSSGIRDVPMPEVVRATLQEWQQKYQLLNERDLVFTTRTGSPVKQTDFYLGFWQPLLKRVGLWEADGDQRHFHALRHFAASWMISNGLPLMDTAEILGHKTFDMTLQVYAHPTVPTERRLALSQQMTNDLVIANPFNPERVTLKDYAAMHDAPYPRAHAWKRKGILVMDGNEVMVAESDKALAARRLGRFRAARGTEVVALCDARETHDDLTY